MNGELLAPAGDERSAYVALDAGADAVYLGLTRFSARSAAENFDVSALARVAKYAHILGAKVYVALNTLVKDDETDDFFRSAVAAWNAGADALLVQDVFLGRELKNLYPDMTLHLSTQGGCCNRFGAEIAKRYGFSRVVLARETPLEDIADTSRIIETEAFVQGALCTCFSGQCYLSSFAGNNSGNRGRCKQPCRKRYSVDAKGYEEPAYALSLSDLSVGERIGEFARAGVSSFKIEGRMRRPEYVAAAVRYYRALLAGESGADERSDLLRAYNRGGYTRGLAFGQDKTLLSRDVQGHIGERVGVLSVSGKKYFCESAYPARRGDGFKILRDGREAGGASFLMPARGGFLLSSPDRLRTGDEVRLTTEAAAGERLFAHKKRRAVRIFVTLRAGERPRAVCDGFVFEGEEPLSAAKSAPVAEETVAACFSKTDGLPLAPDIAADVGDAFCTFSALNAFRRAFYAALEARLAPPRAQLTAVFPQRQVRLAPAAGLAVITEESESAADVVIFKPRDYSHIVPPRRGGVYLYLPPLFTERDLREVEGALPLFEGICCEGTYGIALAEKYGVRLFAGTGFNLTNRYSVCGVKEAGAAYFALSKEISAAEQSALCAEGAFALAYGAVKVMDLCYCPFSRNCAACDRRDVYTLTDEAGRKFPLRRYRIGGNCRFEVYNCAPVAARGGAAALADCSLGEMAVWTERAGRGEENVRGATRGHSDRSFL